MKARNKRRPAPPANDPAAEIPDAWNEGSYYVAPGKTKRPKRLGCKPKRKK